MGQSQINFTVFGEQQARGILGCDAKIDKFSVGLSYAQVDADSVLQGLKDADFGSPSSTQRMWKGSGWIWGTKSLKISALLQPVCFIRLKREIRTRIRQHIRLI